MLKKNDTAKIKFLDHFIHTGRGRTKNIYLVAYGVVVDIDDKYVRLATVTENDLRQKHNMEIMHIMKVNICDVEILKRVRHESIK